MVVTLAGDDTSLVLRILGLVALVLALDYLAMLGAHRIVTTPTYRSYLTYLS